MVVSGIAFLKFDGASSVVVHCHYVAIAFDWKRMSLSMLRPLNHPGNISAIKAESAP